jgi:hypothetical protein
MGYSVGWDEDYKRWKGYGVPCTCEHPHCGEKVDRGMGCLCEACGLAFCGNHWHLGHCERCLDLDERVGLTDVKPFDAKPEHPEWLAHLRNDPSWAKWRKDNMAQLNAWELAAKRAAAQKGE